MSLVASLSSRVFTSVSAIVRLLINRLGVAPLILAATAVAAAVYSWRTRPSDRGNGNGNATTANDADERQPDQQQRQVNEQQQSQQEQRRPRRRRNNTPVGASFGASLFGNGALTGRADHEAAALIDAAPDHAYAAVGMTPATSLRKPQWLSRVRRITIGAACSPTEPNTFFSLQRTAPVAVSVAHVPPSPTSAPPPDANAAPAAEPPAAPGPTVAVTLLPHVLPHLKSFCSLFEVFIVIRVDDDATEAAVRHAFDAAGLFAPGLLDHRKLIFCESDLGRVSVARQLEPQLHVDENLTVIVTLQRFIQFVALVSPDAKAVPADNFGRNVAKFTSLASFFS